MRICFSKSLQGSEEDLFAGSKEVCFLKSSRGFSKGNICPSKSSQGLKEDLPFKILPGVLKEEDLLFKIFSRFNHRIIDDSVEVDVQCKQHDCPSRNDIFHIDTKSCYIQ